MNAARIRICDTPIRISSSSCPPSRASPARAPVPQLVRPTLTTVSARRTHRIRRRAASRIVSRAIVITAAVPCDRRARRARRGSAPRASVARRRPRGPARRRDDRLDQVRNARGIERLDRQPVAVAADRPESLQLGDRLLVEAGGLHAERPGRRGRRRAGPPRPPGRDRRSRRGRRPARPRSAGASSGSTVVPRSRASRMIARTSFRPTGIEGRGGLIEDHEVRGAEERDAQARGAAACPSRRCRRRPRRGRRGRRGRGPRRSRRASPRAAGGPARSAGQHLPGPHPRLIAEQLGEVADPSPRRQIAERRAEDPAAAAARAGQAEQQLDDRRLARAVRAEQAEDLAALDGHRQAVEGAHASVLLGEVDRLDRRAVRHRCPHCRAAEPLAAPQARTNASTGLWRGPAARTQRRDRAG